MSKKKTELTLQDVETFLQQQFSGETTTLRPMIEGEESQAFSFERGGNGYVLRINKAIEGFQKDAYAYHQFHSARIPIPKVIQIGRIDERHAFCISERISGITLQDLDSATLNYLLPPTMKIWIALQDLDLSYTVGAGDFDTNGNGRYATWQHYLLSVLDPSFYDWDYVSHYLDRTLLKDLMTVFTSLVQHCPEERHLVHGDFGSNNILTDGHRITAVLDWDCAKYGDPLFDIATAYFWSSWLECMAVQTAYYEAHISNTPDYRERLLCYQLHIGLMEIYDNVVHQDWEMAKWVMKRCAHIANI
jgi:hygromycin-B 4-O-kinase